MKIVQTACTYDCPDACGLLAEVDGEELVVRGDPAHPITRGTVCVRGRQHPARLRDAERLTAPQRRTPRGWEELSWGDALELAGARLATALDEHGAPSVVLIRGGGSLGLTKNLIGHFFGGLGPVTTVRGGVCGEAGEAAQRLDFGAVASHDYTDLVHSAAVVLWGKNPVATGRHLVPFLREAKERGTPLWLVEPRHTETARLADRVIRVAPGGDGFLALAVLARLRFESALPEATLERVGGFEPFSELLTPRAAATHLERSGATAADADGLAALYADHHPVASLLGWGLQRRHHGGQIVRCLDALAVLTGNVGVAGGGVSYTSWRSRGLDRSALASAPGRQLHAATLGRDLAALDDPPARFVYVACANPVTTHADSRAVAGALQAADFTVVADAFFTDTAAAADLVLPTALMLEEADVVGSYQHHHVAVVRQAVEPPPGARTDLWILSELNRRLGRDEDPLLADPAAALARMARPWWDGPPDGPRRNPLHPVLPFEQRFPTKSGRARLIEGPLLEPPSDPDYPLSLLTPSDRRFQSSQIPEREQTGPLECTVHPDAATAAGLADGAPARLVSTLGAVDVLVQTDDRQHPSLAVILSGGWLRHHRGVNILVAAEPTDVGHGVALYGQPVRLERRAPTHGP